MFKRSEDANKRIKEIEKMAGKIGVDPTVVRLLFDKAPNEELLNEALDAMNNAFRSTIDEKIDPYFDETEFVESEILPLWKKIYDLCEERSIPVLFAITKSKIKEGEFSTALGTVLIGKRVDEKLLMAHKVLMDEGTVLEVNGSDVVSALSSLKDKMEKMQNNCDCPACTERRIKGKESVDA